MWGMKSVAVAGTVWALTIGAMAQVQNPPVTQSPVSPSVP